MAPTFSVWTVYGCVFWLGISYRFGSEKEGMSFPGDGRSALLDVQPLRLKERAAQVSCLPFSVSALMSDGRRANRTGRGEGNNVCEDDLGHRPDEISLQCASVKQEPTKEDSASWISKPIMMPASPREHSGILFELFFKICLFVNNRLCMYDI